MTIIFTWVPNIAWTCPAFRSCAEALGADVRLYQTHHDRYSFSMSWRVPE